MTDRERLIDLLEQEKTFPLYITDDERRERLADYLLENGVIVLPVPVGSPCKIRKIINSDKEINIVDIEEAIVDGVCLLTKNKNGVQIMTKKNVLPIKGREENV